MKRKKMKLVLMFFTLAMVVITNSFLLKDSLSVKEVEEFAGPMEPITPIIFKKSKVDLAGPMEPITPIIFKKSKVDLAGPMEPITPPLFKSSSLIVIS